MEKEEKEPKKPIRDTNISDYSQDQLIEMVNKSNNENFKKLFPDATFDRDQARYELTSRYHMEYIKGIIVPSGWTASQIYDAVVKNIPAKHSKNSHQSSPGTISLSYDLSQKTDRFGLTLSSATYKRWQMFLKKRGIKKSAYQAYATLAMELFMQMKDAGDIDIQIKA